jgi:hypothetical protein
MRLLCRSLSRIGPFDRFLIWIGSDQEKTFGPTISGLITQHMKPESYILWDSKAKGGRPDTMSLIKKAYAEWNAEGEFTVPMTHLDIDFDLTFLQLSSLPLIMLETQK